MTSPLDLPAALTIGFDLDLTLVDSHERIISAYIRALGDLGVKVSREELTPHLGMPLVHTAAAVGAAVDADALVLRYRHYYDEPDAPRTLPMPGALEALHAVHAAGGRTVVVSAKFTPAVHKALAEAGLTDLVDVVYGELFAQDKAGALIAEGASIYVGDHPGDMAAARAANAYAVGVTTGANDEATLILAGADITLPDLAAFVAWLPGHVADVAV
ncbi:MAG TPA: HAD hydrolase-like protein [Dermatophilaceae bacterium]